MYLKKIILSHFFYYFAWLKIQVLLHETDGARKQKNTNLVAKVYLVKCL